MHSLVSMLTRYKLPPSSISTNSPSIRKMMTTGTKFNNRPLSHSSVSHCQLIMDIHVFGVMTLLAMNALKYQGNIVALFSMLYVTCHTQVSGLRKNSSQRDLFGLESIGTSGIGHVLALNVKSVKCIDTTSIGHVHTTRCSILTRSYWHCWTPASFRRQQQPPDLCGPLFQMARSNADPGYDRRDDCTYICGQKGSSIRHTNDDHHG